MIRMALLVMVVMVGAVSIGCSSKSKLTNAQAQIDRLETQVNELESELEIEQTRAAELTAELENALAEFEEKEQVWVEQRNMRSIITVSEAVMFESGSVYLSPTGREIVARIAQATSQYPKRDILVEGHTDDRPIGPTLGEKFPTNWELASGRACAVIHYMSTQSSIRPSQLAAVGYGEHRPIGDNESAEGRAMNRRVVIVIGPESE